MPVFTVPVYESNDCHTPAGSPQGGQFCATDYGRNKTLGQQVDAILRAARARGVPLPGRVQIKAGSVNTGMYSVSNDLLWISPHVMKHLGKAKPGYLADPTLAGVVHHELGHAEHQRAVGDRYEHIRNSYFPPDLKSKIASEVSRYAVTNGLEFVAEVYSGRAAGLRYSDDIMRFYALLGGVLR